MDFEEFRHAATHRLIDLNSRCEDKFDIGQWERWHYDLAAGTLTFSDSDRARVVARIQVVGSTSEKAKNWQWGWANPNLPPDSTAASRKAREFGESERISLLTERFLPDDEFLGWEMTAVTADLVGAKGAYRCPGDDGFMYVVYTDVHWAAMSCANHGGGQPTYVCHHLVAEPAQVWYSREPDAENRWPDAWCQACDAIFQEQREWNAENEGRVDIKLICHHCYEEARKKAVPS